IDAGDWSLDENSHGAEGEESVAAPTTLSVVDDPSDTRPPPVLDALDSGMTGVSMTAEELANAAGLDADGVAELTRYGLLAGRTVGSATLYDDEALVVARLAA